MRKAIAALAAVAVAVSACIGLTQDDAVPPAAPAAIVQQVAQQPDDTPDADGQGEDEEEKKSYRTAASTAKLALRMLVMWPFTLLGHAAAAIFAPVGSVVLRALRFVLAEVLCTFAALLAVLCLLYKALFPNRSLRELLTKRNLLRIGIISVALPLCCRLLEEAFPQARSLMLIVRALLLMLAVIWLWYKILSPKGRFLRYLRRIFMSKAGLCLGAAVVVGCAFFIWMQAHMLINGGVRSTLPTALLTYFICATAALAIFVRHMLLRKKRAKRRLVAVCDGFEQALPVRSTDEHG